MKFRVDRHGSRVDVAVDHDGVQLTLVDGVGLPVDLDGGERRVCTADEPLHVTGG